MRLACAVHIIRVLIKRCESDVGAVPVAGARPGCEARTGNRDPGRAFRAARLCEKPVGAQRAVRGGHSQVVIELATNGAGRLLDVHATLGVAHNVNEPAPETNIAKRAVEAPRHVWPLQH